MRRLIEWKDTNGNKVSTTSTQASAKPSGGSEKRFKKLLDYHIAHKDKDVDKIIQNDINPYGFTYVEHHTNGIGGYTKKVHTLMNARGDWTFSVFIDDKEIVHKNGKGWETFVHDMSFDLNLPIFTTDPEYQDLLEWVDAKGQKVNHTSSASQPTSKGSSKTNKEKFADLVDYMQKHKDSSIIFTSVHGPNDTGFEYEEQRAFTNGDEYNLSVEVECKFGDLFFIHLDMDGNRLATKSASGWEDFLLKLKAYFHVPKVGSPEYISLTESFSIADDFKAYENLWD
jgi:hypothetical protein